MIISTANSQSLWAPAALQHPEPVFAGDFADQGLAEPVLGTLWAWLYFGEPVSGFHLVDGRASFGVGLQLFFLGYPLHFDWTRLTDLKVHSKTRFDFWIGYDF